MLGSRSSMLLGLPLVLCLALVGCSGDDTSTSQGSTTSGTSSGTGSSTSSESTTSGASASVGSGGETGTTSGGATTSDATSAGTTSGDPTTDATTGTSGDPTTGGVDTPPPDQAGPCEYAEIKASFKSAKTGNTVPVRALYPVSGPYEAPYPVVTVAHGFQIPANQYDNYVERLASFCFVAVNVDFPAGFVANHVANAQDVAATLDWVAGEATLSKIADVDNAGATGHSLGGKVSVLAAILEPRFRASITLDPVDTASFCDPKLCPDVTDMLPLAIPLGFVGETLDAMGGFMPCAPADANYKTFYTAATSPALEVTALGANHVSFVDDVGTCGFACGACQMASADNQTVNALSQSFVAAFYQRHLRGEVAYDAWLTGAEAQAKFVATKRATIQSK